MSDGGEIRVLLVADDGDDARLVRELLLTAFPTAIVRRVGAAEVAARQLADAGCAVIAERAGDTGAVELLRSMRAAGFAGGAIVLAEHAGAELVARARRLGGECVERRRMVAVLPAAVLERSAAPGDSRPARELRELQRLVAVGEIAAGFHHEVNNPLTALLAEAQLLEMEPLDEPLREAVRRIVDLCRRVIATVRRLDPIRPSAGAPAAEGDAAGGAPPA